MLVVLGTLELSCEITKAVRVVSTFYNEWMYTQNSRQFETSDTAIQIGRFQ